MGAQRLNAVDLANLAQESLVCDVFNADGELVFARGTHLPPLTELSALLTRGLFCSDAAQARATPAADIYVLRCYNQASRQLGDLLPQLSSCDNARHQLRTIAAQLQQALESAPDLSLACILLQQIGGVYSVRHCLESALLALLLGQACGCDDPLEIACAALTMNVGMLDMHDSLQNRRQQLMHSEIQQIQRHPEISRQILRQAGIEDANWLSYVLLHHENADGSGYPAGCDLPQIPTGARVLALADRYCAQVAARNYRRSLNPQQCFLNICQEFSAPADSSLLAAFMREIGPCPPGARVMLDDGALAVVSRRRSGMPPLLHRLRSAQGEILTPQEQDSRDNPIRDILGVEAADCRFSMKSVWGEAAAL
ncbi:HD domain-containing phosphohydrolase [Massilia sp. W12]|uniref:HD-GYP domain-containing protein n=1 Tax=Massilia sp. W12 TaxID=3126507 RepID=UPI0030CCE0CA